MTKVIEQKQPLCYAGGSFPSTLYLALNTENSWLQPSGQVYSIFTVDNTYYAGWKTNQMSTGIYCQVYSNDNSKSVKTGFEKDEKVNWGYWINGEMKLLELQSIYTKDGLTFAIFTLTDKVIEVSDNPYFTLDPVWPDNVNLKIKQPTSTKNYFLYQLQYDGFNGEVDWRLQTPDYLSSLSWTMVEGTTKVTNSKYFNQAKFRFTNEDIQKGFILIKLSGKVYPNSRSSDTERIYKIYWK